MEKKRIPYLNIFLYIASLALLIGVVSLINVGAQAPQKAQIAFESNRDGNFEIYVMDVDGNNQRNLTNNPALDMCPSWSPDGQMIAFESNRDGDWEVYVMDADGNNPRNLTNKPICDWGPVPSDDDSPSWSPDGRMIAFDSSREGLGRIYVMDADGNNQLRLTNNPIWNDDAPVWSLDGKMIAFMSDRDDDHEIYVMDVDGNNQRRLTNSTGQDNGASWFDPAFAYKAVSSIDSLMSTWGWIKQGSE
jgi:Tol biopolymer transport system component